MRDTRFNTLLCTDTYKMSHMLLYPEDTAEVYSYLEGRKPDKETVFFGLQYIIQEYIIKEIDIEDVYEFLHYYEQILGPAPEKVKKNMFALAELGYWPVEIKAVAEGTVMPTRNVLMTIRSTHPDFAWCVGFLESLLLKVWNPITVATYSRSYKKLVTRFANETCDDRGHIPFQVHDFGYRGVSSEETAAISGAAHLLNFSGSDTVIANWFLDEYYGARNSVKALSVPASEHSVMCAYGRDGEYRAFDRILELNPAGIVSIVSDTYDYWNILTDYAVSRKDQILARDGKVVFRPDSGIPELVINGDSDAEPGSPQFKGSLELLWETFGGTINQKGYRVINPKVGLIYGDGMYYERFERTLQMMKDAGFASSNIVIGVGGLLLQNHNRDELGFAIKATRIVKRSGEKMEIFKDPATDPDKKSKKGLMNLCQVGNDWGDLTFTTFDQVTDAQEQLGLLKIVYKDGEAFNTQTYDEIKANLNSFRLESGLEIKVTSNLRTR